MKIIINNSDNPIDAHECDCAVYAVYSLMLLSNEKKRFAKFFVIMYNDKFLQEVFCFIVGGE